jgi:hypothetical protein
MNPDEEKLIDESIESYRRMIMMHRQSIIRLTRQKYQEREFCSECFDLEIINESR